MHANKRFEGWIGTSNEQSNKRTSFARTPSRRHCWYFSPSGESENWWNRNTRDKRRVGPLWGAGGYVRPPFYPFIFQKITFTLARHSIHGPPSSLHRLRIGNTAVLHPLTTFSNVEDVAIQANNLSPLCYATNLLFHFSLKEMLLAHTHTHTYRCLCTRSQMGTNWSLGEGREGRLMNSPSATNNSQWWRCHR